MQLIVATRNTHKTREIEQILGPALAVRDLTAHPEISEITESGTSFEENAKLKAIAVSEKLPGLVIADDSGLAVEALEGVPGIHSARYAGANASDKEKIAKLLRQLAKVGAKSDQRRARFCCVLAVCARWPDPCDGRRNRRRKKSPNDRAAHTDSVTIRSLFQMDSKKTFAELPEELKNNISHRAKAIRKLQAKLLALCREV